MKHCFNCVQTYWACKENIWKLLKNDSTPVMIQFIKSSSDNEIRFDVLKMRLERK